MGRSRRGRERARGRARLGGFKDHHYRSTHGDLWLRIRSGGSAHPEAELTAEPTEHLRTVGTAHGAVIATSDAEHWTGGTRLIEVVLDKAKAVSHYPNLQRIFTEGHDWPSSPATTTARSRLRRPAQFCEAHHVIDWTDGGPTTLDNGTLLCALHHREFTNMGWQGLMISGRPHWRPPPWIDRHQVPHRNQLHHPVAEFAPSLT